MSLPWAEQESDSDCRFGISCVSLVCDFTGHHSSSAGVSWIAITMAHGVHQRPPYLQLDDRGVPSTSS